MERRKSNVIPFEVTTAQRLTASCSHHVTAAADKRLDPARYCVFTEIGASCQGP